MQTISEQLGSQSQVNIDTALHCAELVFDGAERMLKLQGEIRSATILESAKSIQNLLRNGSITYRPLDDLPKFAVNLDRMLALTRGTIEIAAETHVKLSEIVVQSLKATSDLAMQNMKIVNSAATQSLFGVAGSAPAGPSTVESEARAVTRVRERHA